MSPFGSVNNSRAPGTVPATTPEKPFGNTKFELAAGGIVAVVDEPAAAELTLLPEQAAAAAPASTTNKAAADRTLLISGTLRPTD
jgi:hypothetical protein